MKPIRTVIGYVVLGLLFPIVFIAMCLEIISRCTTAAAEASVASIVEGTNWFENFEINMK